MSINRIGALPFVSKRRLPCVLMRAVLVLVTASSFHAVGDTTIWIYPGSPLVSGRTEVEACKGLIAWRQNAKIFQFSGVSQCPISTSFVSAQNGVCTYLDAPLTLFEPCLPPGQGTEFVFPSQVASVVSKNQGIPEPQNDCPVHNPINAANGNKVQAEVDYIGQGVFPLRLIRYYNGQNQTIERAVGPRWQTNFHVRLTDNVVGATRVITAMRADGKWLEFTGTGAQWQGAPDIREHLEAVVGGGGVQSGWDLRTQDGDTVERYDLAGNLVSVRDRAGNTQSIARNASGQIAVVTDHVGRQLAFSYDSLDRISAVELPGGLVVGYAYAGASGTLDTISFPDGTFRKYRYDSASRLSGIVDENGQQYISWTYDSSGRVVHGENAGGVNTIDLVHSGSTVTVTDALGVSRNYQYQTQFDTKQKVAVSGPPSNTCVPGSTFDASGFVASRTDWNGNRSNFAHNARGLETLRIEGLTASGAATPDARTTTTRWHPEFRLPSAIARPLRITTNVYDADGAACGARGALCSRSVQATTDTDGSQAFGATHVGTPRTWTYKYNANGSVVSMDGPRTDASDVTTYAYYANDDPDIGKRGNVATIQNAAGHVTNITAYNAHGQPLTIVDPNGLTTQLAYDPRQRLTSRTVGAETTTFAYDGIGQLTKISLPDGSFLTYSYDAAHRLVGMQDNLGNRIAYTLDALGNRTREQVFDSAGSLAQTRSRVFNNLNQLFQEIGAVGQVTEYGYDNQGNVTSVRDPLNNVTVNSYDALNRLRKVTDPALGVTQYSYNGLDSLMQVTDPRGLTTGYTVNGLGNLTLQQSPDTGNMESAYDPAGNLISHTDAKGQVTTYAYDALNRVTLISFHDGSKQAYAYDLGPNSLGRLSSITEISPANQTTSAITYAHDVHGRVVAETRSLGAQAYVTAYEYDTTGRLQGLTYPSGRSVSYSFDALGRISAVSTSTPSDAPEIVVQSVSYHPFGGITGFAFGNGQVYSRSVDQDGRIASYTLGAETYALAFDAASRVNRISQVGNPANFNSYGYDTLDRLTAAVLPDSTFGYSYDAVGNRLTKSVGGTSDQYTYGATSNRVVSVTQASGTFRAFTFDANGSTLADGLSTYAYDARGRMVQSVSGFGTTSYQVNALGQRVRKSNSVTDTIFHYDTRGRLIAESDPSGNARREYIYLGDIPVGVIQ